MQNKLLLNLKLDGLSVRNKNGIIFTCPTPQNGGVFECSDNVKIILDSCNESTKLKQEISDLKAKNNEISQALRGAIGSEKYNHIEQLQGLIVLKDKITDILYGRIGDQKIINKQLVDLVKKIRVLIIEVGTEKNTKVELEILSMINTALETA